MSRYSWAAYILALLIVVYFSAPRPISKENISSSKPQPSPICSKKLTPSIAEGPYYKTGSPERTNLKEDGIVGESLTITGFVYDTNCQKIVNAWFDFWQADGTGNYDNKGFKLRGHQYTDSEGKYVLETVIPGKYPGRTPHIHVKIKASQNSPVLTSQLFMPDEVQNETDSIFNKELIMDLKETENGKLATFDFVLSK